jgi:hypothetical protein
VSALTLQNLRDAVRTQLDLDEDDLPNALVDMYLGEGFDRTIALERRWPSYETTWTTTVPAGTEAVELDDAVEHIASVRETTYDRPLMHLSHEVAEENFRGIMDAGSPTFFSIWAGEIHLWPTPTADTGLVIRGWRKPNDWIASGAATEVDADERLHKALIHYACSRAYAQQEDEVLEQTYLRSWEAGVAIARSVIMRSKFTQHPVVLNGGLGQVPRRNITWDL